MIRKCIAGALALIVSDSVLAATSDETAKWSGEAELGMLSVRGNTNYADYHGRAKIVREVEKWRHTGRLDVLRSEDEGYTTGNRLQASGKIDYNINPVSYYFFLLSYDDDDFSGYDERIDEVVGYGYKAINREDMTLDLEIGAGARQSTESFDGDSLYERLIRGAANFSWNFSATSTFFEDLEVDAGSDSTISTSTTGLRMTIASHLSAKITYTATNVSEVPEGIKKTDIETAVTLLYSY